MCTRFVKEESTFLLLRWKWARGGLRLGCLGGVLRLPSDAGECERSWSVSLCDRVKISTARSPPRMYKSLFCNAREIKESRSGASLSQRLDLRSLARAREPMWGARRWLFGARAKQKRLRSRNLWSKSIHQHQLQQKRITKTKCRLDEACWTDITLY